MAPTALQGKLLVAAPSLIGPTFTRTVIAVLEHSPDGALGVVLNRPGDVPLVDVVPAVAELASSPPLLFAGGPVSPQSAIGLGIVGHGASPDDSWRPIRAPLVTVDLDADADLLSRSLRELRVFAGYAGWGAQQLEGEIGEGDWIVVESLPGDAFDAAPTQLWSTVLRRQPWPMSAVAVAPLDPTMN